MATETSVKIRRDFGRLCSHFADSNIVDIENSISIFEPEPAIQGLKLSRFVGSISDDMEK